MLFVNVVSTSLIFDREKRKVHAVGVGRVDKPFAGTTPAVQVNTETAPESSGGATTTATGLAVQRAAAVHQDRHPADSARRPGDGKTHTGQPVGLFAG